MANKLFSGNYFFSLLLRVSAGKMVCAEMAGFLAAVVDFVFLRVNDIVIYN